MIRVTLPQLSLAMTEGKIARWLVADGDLVSIGQPIVEIETDKATLEVEAPATGTIHLLANEGRALPVQGMLAEIVETGGQSPVPHGQT
jgi:pyruvate/2-oxoglutarate dehydrogenase complex dihydrolipoamide acyltransferase (E2) component